ncbi:MAG: extracellular solute-binding protein [Clostridia bacterium]|nr:extracellular solute-binding protein [Clostridia bacterium]
MKRRNHLTAFLLLLCLSIFLFAGCSNSEKHVVGFEDSIILKPEKATQVPHTSKIVLEWENLHALLLEKDGVYLYSGDNKTLLNEKYQPTVWEGAGEIPDACYDDYAIRDNTLYRGNITMKHPLDEDDNLLGFWVLDGVPFLVANRVLYDSQVVDVAISNEYLLYPLSDQVGTGTILEGITGGLWSPVTDGINNYWVSGTNLYRTDGFTVEDLGNLSLMGINYQTVFEMQPVADGVLIASNGILFHLTPDSNEATLEQPQGQGNIIIGTAGYSSPHLTELVAKYNRTSEYKVEIKEYLDRPQLNLAILSGEVDMVGSDDAALLMNYAKRGVLEPLENVIGELLSSGELAEPVLEASRIQGKIYMIPDLYQIYGMVMPKGALEEAGGKINNMVHLTEVLDGLEVQNFYKRETKDITLGWYLFHGVSSWVDDETNTCNFQDETFIAMLELCNKAAKDQSEAMANKKDDGKRPLFDVFLQVICVEDANLRLRYEIKGAEKPFTRYGMEGALFASPTANGAGLTINPDHVYGVLTQSEKKGSCADFLNWLLSTSTQEIAADQGYWGLPMRSSVLEAWVEKTARHTAANSMFSYEETYDMYDNIFDMVASVDHYGGSCHKEIKDIIHEEALRYFKGDISAEKVAEYVQSRASLYLAEQG